MRVLGLPVWWYSRGMMDFVQWSMQTVSNTQKNLALRIWIKNVFVPMYGDDSFTGRLISFFVRLISILFRCIAMALLICALCVGFLVYLILPVLVVVGLLYHVQSLF